MSLADQIKSAEPYSMRCRFQHPGSADAAAAAAADSKSAIPATDLIIAK